MRHDQSTVLLGMMFVAASSVVEARVQHLELRYAPPVGVTYRMHVWTTAQVTVEREKTEPADSMLVEGFESYTRRVTGRSGAGTLVEIRRDSARVRQREGGEPWVPLSTAQAPPPAVVTIDGRGRVVDPPAGALEVGLRPGLVAGPEIVLPDAQVRSGEEWHQEVTVPVTWLLPVDVGYDLPLDRSDALPLRAMMTFDSVLVRGGDSLAFITLAGTLAPVTRARAAEVANTTVVMGGTVTGTIVWSTGWQAFVSGVTESEFQIHVRTGVFGEEPQSSGSVGAHVTTRFRIQP